MTLVLPSVFVGMVKETHILFSNKKINFIIVYSDTQNYKTVPIFNEY